MNRIDEIQKAAKKQRKNTNESTMNKAAVDKLRKLPRCRAFKYHGNQFSLAGHSDIYGCMDGFAFFLEGKLPGQKPRENQIAFLEEMAQAGAITGVYHSPDEAVEIVMAGYQARHRAKGL
jgi:hypothetical protein